MGGNYNCFNKIQSSCKKVLQLLRDAGNVVTTLCHSRRPQMWAVDS